MAAFTDEDVARAAEKLQREHPELVAEVQEQTRLVYEIAGNLLRVYQERCADLEFPHALSLPILYIAVRKLTDEAVNAGVLPAPMRDTLEENYRAHVAPKIRSGV